MKRSAFLTTSALAAVGITTLFTSSSFTEKKKNTKKTDEIEDSDDTFELNEITVLELQNKLEKGA